MKYFALPILGAQLSAILLSDLQRSYELKSSHFNTLPVFRGEPDEDSLQFMKEYYDAVTTICLRELTEDQLRMRCFPYCMKDEAKKWLLALPAGSLITWEAVETKFFLRYYPAWKTREIRGNIAAFEEEPGKAFHETWDLYKSLLAQCPHHMLPFVLLVQCFYDGLTGLTQATVDNACGGAMREKTAREVFAVYEMLGENSQQRRGRDDSREERTNADLGMQLANMSREMENLKANFGQQPIMEEVQVVYPFQDNHQASNSQGWQDHQWGSQDNPSFTEQPISGLEEPIENTAAQVGKLDEKALIDLQGGDVNSLEVEEPEFYEKKVEEVAQESKELISQDVSLEKKISSLEKERDSSLRVIEELKDELAQKDEALDLMKTRELDHLAKLAKAKQKLMAKGKEVVPFPKDELDLGQGTLSATVTKPSLNKSKKKATTKKSNQVPPSPPQNLKDKQPIPGVLKRPTPRLAPRQDKIKQASQKTATNKRGIISHFSPICYKCHIRGHIGSQCSNMKWQRVTNVSPSTKKLVVNSLWIDKTKIEGLKRNGPLWVKKSENGYVVVKPPIFDGG
ncbi:hypothetical protein LWI29_033483 [Acer saccharum]|uniref:Retrotransposon gag domain-containing protein n=1 Tax=Acer saccharum TaxID=4024 RepID=A0AA39VPL2_ACESA|nr:hypothetical protein LWI29_033483 [Acer saccharum]